MAMQGQFSTGSGRSEGMCRGGWLCDSIARRPPMKAVLLPVAGLLTEMLAAKLSGNDFLGMTAVRLMTIPLIFYLYLQSVAKDNVLVYSRFSNLQLAISLAAFLAASVAGGYWPIPLLLLSAVLSIFASLDSQQFMRQVTRDIRRASFALVGALSGPLYLLAQLFWWKPVAI